ncbi:MAG: hypothetical protein MI865_04900 [Proteobacteria bacterium]|nr:hypothetical protein [Pseudomonadota bacterium]
MMSLSVTLITILAAMAVLGFAIYKARQPYQPAKRFHVPYLAIQFIAILTIILMLGHLVTLVTGKPFTGRLG